MIKVVPFNETYVKIQCDDYGIEQELSDYFTFFAAGYKFQPKFRAGIWDGKLRLFNLRSKTIYKGLIYALIKFAQIFKYELVIDNSLKNTNDITLESIKKFTDSLNLHGKGNKLEIREYQYDAIHNSINNDRSLLVSPTSSGKSLILYSICRWHIDHHRKIMIVVPSTMLVEQLFSDFQDYSSHNGFNVDDHFSVLYSGKERVFDKSVVISTWQSLAAMMKNDEKKFMEMVNRTEVACFDEAHTYKANVVLSVLEKFTKTKYRIGTTGTLDDTKIHQLTLTGLMGPVYTVTTTKKLMDDKQVVDLKINCLVLNYPEHIRKAYKNQDYQEEINFLVGYTPRNDFIARLATSTKGNTLVLQNFVERHGGVIEQKIRQIAPDREVYFIHGEVKVEERERIRQLLDTKNDVIVVATSSLFSTGVNIPSLENIIFAIPTKSTIRIRQSIGRGLRLKNGKTVCNLFDISDDLSWKKSTNITLGHLEDRIKIYEKEQFDYIIKHLKIQ